MEDKDLVPAVIDFAEARDENGELKESWGIAFGSLMRWVMPALFDPNNLFPLEIRGNKQEVQSLARVLAREKNYLRSWKDQGLDNPQTYKSKSKLDKAVGQFERTTGLKWPFK
tara:strand:+ start:932 stop:1270 length:339 start_codon:yes stop_codon:yes gene_type:complete